MEDNKVAGKVQNIKPLRWLGIIQVQLQNAFFYLSVLNFLMLAVTFWYTSGYTIAQAKAQWLTLPVFLGGVVGMLVVVMVIDAKWLLPARMAYTNVQSCKTENPAMEAILRIEEDVKKIKAKIGVDEVCIG